MPSHKSKQNNPPVREGVHEVPSSKLPEVLDIMGISGWVVSGVLVPGVDGPRTEKTLHTQMGDAWTHQVSGYVVGYIGMTTLRLKPK